MRNLSLPAHGLLTALRELAGMTEWGFHEGDEIAAGLHFVRRLGGGRRYQADLAWSDRMRALVVAKVVRPHLVEDPATLAGLDGEARLARELAHPMLLRSFGASVDGERPHLVLEFIEGPRLSTLIRRYDVGLEQLLPLALNLCAVLHYLGEEGVVHLDLKPSNIIMAADPRLIDLSIACRSENLGRLTAPVGTDAYMAPEQCDPRRFGDLGPASDVWGLGATLYEGLTGRRPFARSSGRFPQLDRAPAPLDGSVPAPLAWLIMSCLESGPGDRPTAAALADALEPLVDALPAARLGRFRPAPRPYATSRPDFQEVLR